MVSSHVGRAVLQLQIIDPDQYGGIPRYSTLFALLSMMHLWSQATNAAGVSVRFVLFDPREAFDLIDHSLLAAKIHGLDRTKSGRLGVRRPDRPKTTR